MKLNLACGENRLDGFENHDTDVDLTKPLPWPDNSVEFILLEHICEHLTGPQCLGLFDECRRILNTGGTLRVCVPILDRLDRDKRRDIILNHGHLIPMTERTIPAMLFAAGFDAINIFGPCPLEERIDGHWKIIGITQDGLETSRWQAFK